MRPASGARSLGLRLAPAATLTGIVVTGLTLLVFTAVVTAPGFGPVEEHVEHVVDDTALITYPVPVPQNIATRVTVSYYFPEHGGTAMILGCSDFADILGGHVPTSDGSSSSGSSGHLVTSTAPEPFGTDAPKDGCGFLYVMLRWDLKGQDPAVNRPVAQVTSSPVLLPGLLMTSALVVGGLGLALTLIGGTVWARSHASRNAPSTDDETHYVAETLLMLVDETGEWLARMRRYLIAAGVLGVFLWYPVVLPWAWRRLLEGSSGNVLPFFLAAAAVSLLVVLTVVWARTYLRLDRRLMAWRERVGRLHEQEQRLLGELERAR